MRKLLYLTLLVSLLSNTAFAQKIFKGHEMVVKDDITFLSSDWQGIGDLFDLFKYKTSLDAGYSFLVSEVFRNCDRKWYSGKLLIECRRRLELTSDNCGVEDTEGEFLEQDTNGIKFRLRVKDQACLLTVSESFHNTMFSTPTKQNIDDKSGLDKFLIHLQN